MGPPAQPRRFAVADGTTLFVVGRVLRDPSPVGRQRTNPPKLPKLAAFMDESEADVLAYMSFRPSTVPSCTAPTRSNASTGRSNAGLSSRRDGKRGSCQPAPSWITACLSLDVSFRSTAARL